jgi:cytochrome c peroxidase
MRTELFLGAVICAVLSGAAMSACSDTASDTPAPDSGTPTDGGTPLKETGSPDSSDADAPDVTVPPDFSDEDLAVLHTLSPLPAVPADPTNAVADNAAAATLGQMLFFEKSYSGPLAVAGTAANGGLGAVGATGKVGCDSCHLGAVMDDRRSLPGNVSLGTNFGTRRALAVVSSSFYTWTNWGGRFDSQWSLAPAVAENPKIMDSTRLTVAHMIYAKYKTEYEAVFGALDPRLDPADANAPDFPATGKPKAAGAADGPWELMAAGDRTIVNTIFANFGKAIEAYMRKLVSRDSAFDQYVAGNLSAMTAAQKNGAKVFLHKGACISCHSGPHFEDAQFHALAVPQTGPNVPAADLGRFADVPALLASPFNTNGPFSANVNTGKLTGLVQADSQKGQFRTKSLRGVAVAGPYMHSGQLATLKDVVSFYNAGGGDAVDAGEVIDPKIKPLGLSTTEAADLVDFMGTLTGAPLAGALTTNTSK